MATKRNVLGILMGIELVLNGANINFVAFGSSYLREQTLGYDGQFIALFVIGAMALSFVCHAAWALLLSASPVRAAYQGARRWIEGALGAFFAFAAIKLVTSRI